MTIFGEIAAVVLVVLIVGVARRYSVSDPATRQPPIGSTDAGVWLVAPGRKIDAIKLYRSGTDLKTAKDAIDQMRPR